MHRNATRLFAFLVLFTILFSAHAFAGEVDIAAYAGGSTVIDSDTANGGPVTVVSTDRTQKVPVSLEGRAIAYTPNINITNQWFVNFHLSGAVIAPQVDIVALSLYDATAGVIVGQVSDYNYNFSTVTFQILDGVDIALDNVLYVTEGYSSTTPLSTFVVDANLPEGSFATVSATLEDQTHQPNNAGTAGPENIITVIYDTDNDGALDSIDPDDDNDGVFDTVDAFPYDISEWADADGDGFGDNGDMFPANPNEHVDSDGDGVGDNGDAFPNNPGEQLDTDGDNVGNNADPDDDGDGVLDIYDPFPLDSSEWVDNDGDGVGNNADLDDDNDGLSDIDEAVAKTDPYNPDTDGDGSLDGVDQDPLDPTIGSAPDPDPPNAPHVTGSTLTNKAKPVWSWSSGGNGGSGLYRYKLDNTNLTSGATQTFVTTYTASTSLSDGAHTLYIQERSAAGLWSTSGSYRTVVDTTPPPAPTVSGSSSTGDLRPTWSWSSNGGSGSYRYALDHENFSEGSTTTTLTSFAPTVDLSPKLYTLYVQERDQAGNWSTSGTFITAVTDDSSNESGDKGIAQTVQNQYPMLSETIDFNDDGRCDVMWRNVDDGRNIVWLMDSGVRTDAVLTNSVTDFSWQLAGTGDFDGDGKSDLFWRNQLDGRNLFWFMNGGLRSDQALAPTSANLDWRVAATRDFDGDGKTDILWRTEDGRNILWFMDGGYRKGAELSYSVTNPAWALAAVDDFDGDGKADMLWRNDMDGRNIIWLMDGAGRKQAILINSVTDFNWQLQGSGDFDGDGKADLLWRNIADGRNLLWFMNGGTRTSQALAPTAGNLDWQVGALGDFDGDFKTDILWRTADGRNIFWFMNAGSRDEAILTNSVTNMDWTLSTQEAGVDERLLNTWSWVSGQAPIDGITFRNDGTYQFDFGGGCLEDGTWTGNANNVTHTSLSATASCDYFQAGEVATSNYSFDASGNLIFNFENEYGNSFYKTSGSSETSMGYIDNGNATFTDNSTGLTWLQSPEMTYMDWFEAESYCDNLTFAGASDWRMPNLAELKGLVDLSYWPDRVCDPVFECTTGYWTSSYTPSDDRAVSVNFYNGETNSTFRTEVYAAATCVR